MDNRKVTGLRVALEGWFQLRPRPHPGDQLFPRKPCHSLTAQASILPPPTTKQSFEAAKVTKGLQASPYITHG